MLPQNIALAIRDEILDVVDSAQLVGDLRRLVTDQLSGHLKVLPEGKSTIFSVFVFNSYHSVSGSDDLDFVPAAAAIEFLIAAYDLVDDIEDGEYVVDGDRRTLGASLETICTLLLLSHVAIERLRSRGVSAHKVLKALNILDDMAIWALRGQTRDMALEDVLTVGVEESLEVTSWKSGSLLRCASELGACIGTEDSVLVDLHARMGWHMGLVAQLMNDIEAIWPEGKDKSDLRLKKKTLPIAYALNISEETDEYSRTVHRYFRDGSLSGVSEDDVKWALWKSEAVHYTWMVAASEKAKAQEIHKMLGERGHSEDYFAQVLN